MVRYDIVTAIRNAVERGESVEKARQILINSGYGASDVNEAVNYLTGGASNELQNITPQVQIRQIPVVNQAKVAQQGMIEKKPVESQMLPNKNVPQKLPIQTTQLLIEPGDEEPKKRNTVAIAILSVLLFLLFLALILTLVFQDQVIVFFKNLMG